ncbi:sensor histidine kinase response regulator [Citrifermentans bemidjiense Bem]|uniref:histidine kinase n=1 Tax=Citrifermentans bemidjiense (strain ATCC BAA-1014 / DSM 16622 / JCM 12645 / Bem) TaxID=404380 RepID=B5EIZ5_CITBB|nr:ATP-binding protein [Citrifermentans bemidjiense]ACH39950.1 sensor histidine kinase response regulator [Citrifermentans bemidjiense Bem]
MHYFQQTGTNDSLDHAQQELKAARLELQAKSAELERARNDLENFLSCAWTATAFFDRELRPTRLTPTLAQLLDLSPDDTGELLPKLCRRLDWPNADAELRSVVGGAVVSEREVSDLLTGHQFLLRFFPYLNAEGETEGAVLKLIDISDYKLADQRLLEYRAVFECTGDMIYVFDRNYLFLLANKAYLECHRVRHEELVGRTVQDLLGPMMFAEVKGHIDACFAGEEVIFESRYDYPAKGVRDILITYTPLKKGDRVDRVACLIKDMTERTQLEEQLRHAQKMEAIGTLAGGIAHDFNNLLTVIAGYASLIQFNSQGSEVASMAAEIQGSVERAAEMTRGLLAFSRKQAVNLMPVELNQLVEGLHKSLRRLITEDIELAVEVSSVPLIVSSDKGQLEQVLFNLVVNARDAMPSGGKLLIRTERLQLNHALITVADTGVGMSREVQDRVFEPFFTTKELGVGTGLGLSTCYGIIKKHNGIIELQSEPGAGTVFSIYLPLSEELPEADSAGGRAQWATGNETVLLVEDDETVRTMTRLLLQHNGYRVLCAREGEEALNIFAEQGDGVDLLLTDLVMPRLNGTELGLRIHAQRPDFPTIFMSGYPADIVSQKGIAATVDYLAKPIKPELLLRRIREALDAPGVASG